MASQPPPPPRLGARFTFTGLVDRHHFVVPAGATGTVVEAQPDLIGLYLDRYVPGAEPWNNEVVFSDEDDYDRAGQPAARPRAARAFYCAARPLEESAIPEGIQTPDEADGEPFERDPQEGVQLLPYASGLAHPVGVAVYLLGKELGEASYHPPALGARRLAGAAYWYARTPGGRFVNRAGDPAGIELGQSATTGQSTREQAIGLLLAAHAAGLR